MHLGTTDTPKLFVCDMMGHWLFGLTTIDLIGLTGDDRTLEYPLLRLELRPGRQPAPVDADRLHAALRAALLAWPVLRLDQDNRITFSIGIPTVINMLLDDPVEIDREEIASLAFMSSSTAPLAPERWQQFEDRYGVKLLQFYGCSEGGWVCGNRHYYNRKGTVGPPAKHQEFLLVDEDGNRCPPGGRGRGHAGRAAMRGRLDVGRRGARGPQGPAHPSRGPRGDGRGRVRHRDGRLKDLIIRGGVNIAPAEIDNVLLRHPKCTRPPPSACPDPIYGEEVVCYVVGRSGERLTADEIAGALPGRPARVPGAQGGPLHRRPAQERPRQGTRPDLREIWERDRAG